MIRWTPPAIACHVMLLLAAPSTSSAESLERYRAEAGGITLELSAPRADILRVRAGRGVLPEDASWAVLPERRASRVPFSVAREAHGVRLDTGALTVHLDPATLRLTVADAAGHVLLDDAPGQALVLEAPGSGSGLPVRLRKAMPADAHYFGLGDKTGPLDRRGGTFALWNTDAYGFGESTDPIYKSIPFVLSARESGPSVGLLVDSTWRSSFDFGHAERDTLAVGIEGGGLDYYVLAAGAPRAVVEAYGWLTGTPPLPPRWALGFQQSRYSYMTADEVRTVARRLRDERIPADVLYLDIDYQDRNRPFTVSHSAFPDLPGLLAELRGQGFEVVLITDLHIARVDGEGYAPYESGRERHAFLRRADGSTYVAPVWPGPSVFPDFSRADIRDWWGGLYAEFLRAGVAGFWNDMNEPAIFEVREKTMPLDNVHRIEEPGFQTRDATHAEMHNVYGMLNSRATFEGLQRLAPGRRPFVLTRASYAGGQRYAATWTGDNLSTWNHLRLSVSQLVNLGLSGFGLAGDDIGGFGGAGPSPDLLTRWLELGAFNPVFRDHTAQGKPAQEPYVGHPGDVAIRRRYIEERYRLLPYLYTLAEEQARTGVPMMRPVFLEYPEVLGRGERLGGTADEFMLGAQLLVAPSSEPESPFPYRVSLPAAGWYDYWTGERLATATRMEQPTLERLPVYVRPGAILVRQGVVQSSRSPATGPLEIAVYPGPGCQGELYADDGETTDYRSGAYLRRHLSCTADADAIRVAIGAPEGGYPTPWPGFELVIHGITSVPRDVRVAGVAVRTAFDARRGTLRVPLGEQPGALDVAVAIH